MWVRSRARCHWPDLRSRPGIWPACSIPFNLSTSARDDALAMAFWSRRTTSNQSICSEDWKRHQVFVYIFGLFQVGRAKVKATTLDKSAEPWQLPRLPVRAPPSSSQAVQRPLVWIWKKRHKLAVWTQQGGFSDLWTSAVTVKCSFFS